jgi:hypothetical protein
VHHAVDNDRIVFDLEKRPIVTDAKAILRREIGEPLYVARKSIFQLLQFCGDSRCVPLRRAAQILYCLRLQYDLHN